MAQINSPSILKRTYRKSSITPTHPSLSINPFSNKPPV